MSFLSGGVNNHWPIIIPVGVSEECEIDVPVKETVL
jgi:hypothetical protein